MKTLFISSLLVFSNLTFADSNSQKAKEQKTFTLLTDSTKALVESELVCSTSRECFALALGSRACGGPAKHVVASKNNPHLSLIKLMAKKTTELQSEFNHKYGVVSICMLAPVPQVDCIDHICQEVE